MPSYPAQDLGFKLQHRGENLSLFCFNFADQCMVKRTPSYYARDLGFNLQHREQRGEPVKQKKSLWKKGNCDSQNNDGFQFVH